MLGLRRNIKSSSGLPAGFPDTVYITYRFGVSLCHYLTLSVTTSEVYEHCVCVLSVWSECGEGRGDSGSWFRSANVYLRPLMVLMCSGVVVLQCRHYARRPEPDVDTTMTSLMPADARARSLLIPTGVEYTGCLGKVCHRHFCNG